MYITVSCNAGGDTAEATRCPYCAHALDYDRDNIVTCPHCGKTVFYIWDRAQFFTQAEYLGYVQERSYQEMERVAKRYNFVTAKYKQLGQNLLAPELANLVDQGQVKKTIKVRSAEYDDWNESIEWVIDDYAYALPSPRQLAYLVSLGFHVDRLLTKTETSFLIDMMKEQEGYTRHPFDPEKYGTFTLEQVYRRLSGPYQITAPLAIASDQVPAAVTPSLPAPVTNVQEIKSADLDQLGSERMFQVRDKILSAYEERRRRTQKIQDIEAEYRRLSRQWFGIKKLILPLFPELDGYKHELENLQKQIKKAWEWHDKCRLRIASKLSPQKENSWQVLTDAFRVLAKSQIYDVVSESETGGVVSRTKVPVQFTVQSKDIIESPYPVLHLQNANGADLYMYPNFVIMEDGERVAVIDMADLHCDTQQTDSELCFVLKTDSGLREMYSTASITDAQNFLNAFGEYLTYAR